jgi:hypothetical protein
MLSLHDVHKMKAYRVNGFCPSVRIFHLENRWTNGNEILCGRCAIRDHHRVILFKFLDAVVNF